MLCFFLFGDRSQQLAAASVCDQTPEGQGAQSLFSCFTFSKHVFIVNPLWSDSNESCSNVSWAGLVSGSSAWVEPQIPHAGRTPVASVVQSWHLSGITMTLTAFLVLARSISHCTRCLLGCYPFELPGRSRAASCFPPGHTRVRFPQTYRNQPCLPCSYTCKARVQVYFQKKS